MNLKDLPVPYADLPEKLQMLFNSLESHSVFKSAIKIQFAIDGCSCHFDTITPSEIAQLAHVAATSGLNYALIAGKDTIIFRYYLS